MDVRECRVAVKPDISSGTFTIVWKSILNCATRTPSIDITCQTRSTPRTLQVKIMRSSGQGRSSLLVRLASPTREDVIIILNLRCTLHPVFYIGLHSIHK